jgi:hypothetical protein
MSREGLAARHAGPGGTKSTPADATVTWVTPDDGLGVMFGVGLRADGNIGYGVVVVCR